MGYEDGQTGKTGRLGEREAKEFLNLNGFHAIKAAGKDVGVDLIVSPKEDNSISAKAQVKGRQQIENQRWFQLSITPSQIADVWSNGQQLDSLWKKKIQMVDFWIMVSIPLKEVWIMPSKKVMEIANLNSTNYSSRLDNQYDKTHYKNMVKLQGNKKN